VATNARCCKQHGKRYGCFKCWRWWNERNGHARVWLYGAEQHAWYAWWRRFKCCYQQLLKFEQQRLWECQCNGKF
jgi:hypothetical protein